jgi:hypothetical protein
MSASSTTQSTAHGTVHGYQLVGQTLIVTVLWAILRLYGWLLGSWVIVGVC